MELSSSVVVVLLSLAVASATEAAEQPLRICVLQNFYDFCVQMEQDLPNDFQCVKGRDMMDCSKKIQQGDADVSNMDANSLYIAGKFFGLVPTASELMDGVPYRYQSIALVSKNSNITSPRDLQGTRSCHTGLGRTAGWQIPVGLLLSRGIMTPYCMGEIHTVASFFSQSCAPGKWSADPVVDAELKRVHSSLCSQCQNPESCSAADEFAGYEGSIQCLLNDRGDVAFTKMPALKKLLEKQPEAADSMELLCLDGGRKSVLDNEPCIWDARPSNAFVSTEANRERVLRILQDTVSRYPPPRVNPPEWLYKVFFSSNSVTGLQPAGPDRDTYISYLGNFLHAIERILIGCDPVKARFCVISEPELRKCNDYSKAARARSMSPEVECVLTTSKAACMEALRENNADFITLDGGDVYRGGRYFDLQPVAAELYGTSDATYYAVAVLRSLSDVSKLSDLRDLRSCHTGFGRTAGWVIPVGALVEAGELPSTQCNRAEAVADFFSSCCVPGANDTKYNPGRTRAADLCRQCIGDQNGNNKCSRDNKERYSGYSGAFRCLADGDGDVAFIKHSTVPDYTDGKNSADWAKDLLSSDFKLLCRQGGNAPVTDYADCNLAKVPSHYVMTSGGNDSMFRVRLSILLAASSKYFGDESSIFRLFEEYEGHADLLFKDSTTSLKVPSLTATYQEVLGEEFYSASEAADPKSCTQ